MQRLTEQCSRVTVLCYGLDGKRNFTFDLIAPTSGFADLCNTIDHLRNAGLEPAEPDAVATTQQRRK